MAWVATLRVSDSQNGTYTALPEPAEMTYSIQDIDSASSGRSETGNAVRDRVAIKRKLTLKWALLDKTQASALLESAIKNETFWCKYQDPMNNVVSTRKFYVGDRTLSVFKRNSDGSYVYQDLTADFVEV